MQSWLSVTVSAEGLRDGGTSVVFVLDSWYNVVKGDGESAKEHPPSDAGGG